MRGTAEAKGRLSWWLGRALWVAAWMVPAMCVQSAEVPSHSCNDLIEMATGHPAGQPGPGMKDSVLIDLYGSGRREKMELPGSEEATCLICSGKPVRPFVADDYTHLAARAGGPSLQPGDFLAEILPPDRQRVLVDGEPEFDSGTSGAVILRRIGDEQGQPIVIHSGARAPGTLARLPSLLMAPSELDRFIGTLLGTRSEFGGDTRTWEGERFALGDDSDCRAATFEPFHVRVVGAKASWRERHFGARFGASVAAVAEPERVVPLAVVDADTIDRAQLTAGLNPLGFDQRLLPLFRAIDRQSASIRAVVAQSLNDDERLRRLTSLNQETRDTLGEASVLLEGLRESARMPDFQSSATSWPAVIRLLEQSISGLDELSDNEVAPVLLAGDSGSVVKTLWLPSSGQAQTTAVCRLDPIVRRVPAQVIPLPLPGGVRPISVEGQARFWFTPVPALPGSYRLDTSLRLDVGPFRKLHRQMAGEVVDRMKALVNSSCEQRISLRETDQAAGQNGALYLKANVREEAWWCGWYKYPCGLSIHGTKSCRKNVRTRLFSFTKAVRQQVETEVAGTTARFRMEGEGIGQPVQASFDLAGIPGLTSLMTMAGLRPIRASFVEWNAGLWHATELRGEIDLDPVVACAIADQLGRN